MIRALLAGLFVFGSMLAAAVLVGEFQPHDSWSTWAKLVPTFAMLVAIVVALQFFNPKGQRLSDSKMSAADRLKMLETAGLVDRRKFSAIRCFAVAESEDEGSHYYLELHSGDVLHLTGQYLYDYEPTSDDPELNQPRGFPCTEFEILRHKNEGYVLTILCTGQVLEPELIAPAYSEADWERGIPDDGIVIAGKNYEQLKTERSGKR